MASAFMSAGPEASQHSNGSFMPPVQVSSSSSPTAACEFLMPRNLHCVCVHVLHVS